MLCKNIFSCSSLLVLIEICGRYSHITHIYNSFPNQIKRRNCLQKKRRKKEKWLSILLLSPIFSTKFFYNGLSSRTCGSYHGTATFQRRLQLKYHSTSWWKIDFSASKQAFQLQNNPLTKSHLHFFMFLDSVSGSWPWSYRTWLLVASWERGNCEVQQEPQPFLYCCQPAGWHMAFSPVCLLRDCAVRLLKEYEMVWSEKS